jgi:DNA-binding winged helix-turn-helix (wHTH) protein
VDRECRELIHISRANQVVAVSDFSHSLGPFRLNPARRILTRDGKPLRLGSRALDLLIALVESGDNLISKEDLLKRVWPDTYIEEANLRVHIAAMQSESVFDQLLEFVDMRI